MAVLIVLSFQSDRFFTVSNLLNQGRLMTETGLIAIAMTTCILLVAMLRVGTALPVVLANVAALISGGIRGVFAK